MTAEVRAILEDLYAIDPELRTHGAELERVVAEILAVRPSVTVDAVFRAELRTKLMERAAALGQQPLGSSSFASWFTLPHLAYGFGGLTAVVVLAVVAVQQFSSSSVTRQFFGTYSNHTGYVTVADGAFGSLATLTPAGSSASPAPLGLGAPERSATFGSPLGQPEARSSAPMTPFALGQGVAQVGPVSDSTATSEQTMVYPAPGMRPQPWAPYRFVYRGAELKNLEPKVMVLRRVTGEAQLPAATDLVQSLEVPGISLPSFPNLKLSQLTLNQDSEYGYSIYVDLAAGQISVNQNLSRWPQPWAQCQDQTCAERYQLKESDVPQDGELVASAKKFLQEHGVETASYGEPYMQNDWRTWYLKLALQERATYYLPGVATVVFALRLKGHTVFEGGAPSGLGVSVSLRDLRVTGFWNLTTNAFEASAYPAETDAAKLLAAAESGGQGYGGPGPFPTPLMAPSGMEVAPNEPTTNRPMPEAQVELGTPEYAYLKLWNYRSGTQADELYVPALAFPITKAPVEVEHNLRYVVVQLVKDFWGNVGGPIRIMQGGASAGSAGASSGVAVPPTMPVAEPAPAPQPGKQPR